MNLLSEQLQLFVTDSLNPQKFAGHQISKKEFENWKAFLSDEIAGIKHQAGYCPHANRGKNKNGIISFINQIVDLSNAVNIYLTKLHPIWKTHPQAEQIRANYQYTCNVFEELIAALCGTYRFAEGLVKITNYNLPQVKMHLKQQHHLLAEHLNDKDIDEPLKELALYGFSLLMQRKELRGIDEAYLQELADIILQRPDLDTQAFMELLITHDFNLPEFFHYCVSTWRKRLSDIPGLHEQQEMLLTERDQLYNLHIEKGLQMPGASSLLYEDLDRFLSEKYAFAKQLLKLRRDAVMDKEKAKAGIRFLMNLPVPQFGLFIRMQIEKGLLPKENVGDLFSFFALHFYTPHTLFMSAESLQKKSTDVEFSTAQKMKGHLIGMLNWLNSNFNLSNYN
ncbi:hypothetical protein G7092_17010 [Mucilaginibacter sp. HC2]|uniref:hypothetical protein n=1 Tax=Mucilaginibacter TaxID=423349 RepID=UPI000DCB74AF|nr:MULTISPECIES: hypothetical protein [Mucilaginibacter]NHA05513.1 hypothetical protein [Mucilaginibacter inviolabilis]QTE35321.1 hypothetical protein J3L18_19485 [Mucilaginibacter gossypii]RAV59476.1 hypothetical protein DIU36_06505 [Mucilaginibacter rubeus]